MRQQLEFFQAGSEVKRYHTVTTIQQETVGHHSHGVAMILMILMDDNCPGYLLAEALLHDLAEHQTGDIPSPAKIKYGIGEQVSDLEERLLRGTNFCRPNIADYERRMLKLADIAQGAMFCAREISLGNSKMRVIFDRYISYAENLMLMGRERELFDIIKGSV
jgi:5'-deoxynucleotidase YfbR-like HD superfamily hydrolase